MTNEEIVDSLEKFSRTELIQLFNNCTSLSVALLILQELQRRFNIFDVILNEGEYNERTTESEEV